MQAIAETVYQSNGRLCFLTTFLIKTAYQEPQYNNTALSLHIEVVDREVTKEIQLT